MHCACGHKWQCSGLAARGHRGHVFWEDVMQLFMRRASLDDLPDLPPLPAGYILREYRESDCAILAALLQIAFEDPSWDANKVHWALIDAPDVQRTFVIVRRDTVVATASARLLPTVFPDSGYVHYVAAYPSHRGKKLGATVSLAVLHEFRRLGCRDAVLETDDHRLPAIKTYLNLGFQPEFRHASHAARWAAVTAQLTATENPEKRASKSHTMTS